MQNKTNGLAWLLRIFHYAPLPLLQSLAKMIANILSVLPSFKTIQTIRLNIEIALGDLSEADHERISKLAIQNELTSYFEFMQIWQNNNQQNLALIHQVHGHSYFKQALNEEKGVVLIIPHFGTWEVMNAWISQHTDLTIMYMPIKNPSMNQIVLDARQREGATLVQTNETGVKQIFKALKGGGTTVILPDHTPKQGGELVPWFGVPVESSQLCAKMIQKTGARALVLYALRNDQSGFDIHIEAMGQQIYDRTQNGTAIIHQHIEQLIRRHPQHYHWSYKRFKANPESKKVYSLPHAESIDLIRSIQSRNT